MVGPRHGTTRKHDELTGTVWERAGRKLEERRVKMGLSLAAFTRQHDTSRRVCWDIENWQRDNYGPLVLDAITAAYGYPPGSLRRFIAGDETALETPAKDLAASSSIDAIAKRVWGGLEHAPQFVRRVMESDDVPDAVKLDLLVGYITDPREVSANRRRGA
jgi:hypothetical protein